MWKKATLLAAAAMLFAGPALAQTKIKYANYLPPRSIAVTKIATPWIKMVEEAVPGEVKFQGFWGGSLGRSPFKQLKLVMDGVTDIAVVGTHYASGQFPDNAIMELPFMVRSGEEASAAMWRLYDQGLLSGYDDVKVLTVYAADLSFPVSREPIKLISDLKGMKVRTSGAVSNLHMRTLGAVPVSMAVNKLTEALDRGVVDATLMTWGSIKTFRLHQVASHFIYAPVNVTTFSLLMNKKSWESLPAPVKQQLNKLSGEMLAKMSGRAYDDVGMAFYKQAQSNEKLTIIVSSEEELKQARAQAQPVFDDWMKDTPDGQKKLAAFEKILTDIRAGN